MVMVRLVVVECVVWGWAEVLVLEGEDMGWEIEGGVGSIELIPLCLDTAGPYLVSYFFIFSSTLI